MQFNEIAIVILSCDKFRVTWQPCIDHFFKAWPECRHQVYLLNNFISSKDKRIKNLLVGEDLNWSDTLKKGLLKIEEKRIFFIFDDSFINKFDFEEITSIFKLAIENNLDSVSFRKKRYGRVKRFNRKLNWLSPNTKYRNSLFLNLFKKKLLLSLLKSGENAWQFEKDGNERNKKFDFYSVSEDDLITYKHGIVKGKWLPKTYAYLKDEGYLLEENVFKKHNAIQMLRINAYTYIFFLAQKFFHLFK